MDIQAIIQCLDRHLERSNQDVMNPVEAGEVLERAGLLRDSAQRPGLPLRNLLRKGKLPHAFQPGGKGSGWVIPHSGKKTSGSHQKQASTNNVKTGRKLKPNQTPPSNSNLSTVGKNLMDTKRQIAVGEIDEIVPNVPGIYCVRIEKPSALPAPFNRIMKERGHNIIYIGIASKSLRRRMLGQELRARGHGTFFRSMGALLGHTPPKGSLIGKSNQKNYKFSSSVNAHIIDWMNDHLTVHWEPMENGWNELETALIEQHLPLVNISKNPAALAELSRLRRRCVDIACGR